jgi:chorismate mutase
MSDPTHIRFASLSDWLQVRHEPLLIAGPCSAESREQVMQTAIQLAATGLASVFRAGVWKPRTRPGSFQGKGKEALLWLAEAKAVTGLKTCVEVATTAHVEACLQTDIDMVWIGARTSVNPFYVEEIAKALQGSGLAVLVKNPLNPDLHTWIGAIERLYRHGITNIAAVHRGFNAYGETTYRNLPLWEIPIELKRLHPDLPVICDPSHIAGRPELMLRISQHALDLDMDGLMIEVHHHPESALTDAKQQITPAFLRQLINNLVKRTPGGISEKPCDDLKAYRKQIDEIDAQLLEFLARRMEIAGRIGQLKKEHNMTILQLQRWSSMLKSRLIKARELGLDTRFLQSLLELVHKESINIQQQVMNKNTD